MLIQLVLTEDRLVVVESDDSNPDTREEAAIEKMIEALEAGTISEAEFVEWMCLRLRVAEAPGEEATA